MQELIENLGKRRYTTRKEEGGSGIGLMTAFELLKTKKAVLNWKSSRKTTFLPNVSPLSSILVFKRESFSQTNHFIS